MKAATLLVVLLCLAASCIAWPTGGFASQNKGMPTIMPDKKNEHSEITTELQSLDTLDVMPSEMETQDGGVRKVSLEKNVFRRQTPIDYQSFSRRDPFRPLLVDARSQEKDDPDPDLLRMDGAKLQGVVWADGQYMALVKDKSGKIFFLREGDSINQGHVLMVSQAQAVFEIADFGDYDQITLKVKG
jgi:hypothetical protein